MSAVAYSGARYPVHDQGRCGGALVPLAADGRSRHVFCTACGSLFDGGDGVYRGALRAQRAAGIEPERLTSYLARVLDELRARSRPVPRGREAS